MDFNLLYGDNTLVQVYIPDARGSGSTFCLTEAQHLSTDDGWLVFKQGYVEIEFFDWWRLPFDGSLAMMGYVERLQLHNIRIPFADNVVKGVQVLKSTPSTTVYKPPQRILDAHERSIRKAVDMYWEEAQRSAEKLIAQKGWLGRIFLNNALSQVYDSVQKLRERCRDSN